MKSRIIQGILLVGLAWAAGAAGLAGRAAAASWQELARYVPPQANTIVLLDAEKLWNSPIGKRQQWREQAVERNLKNPFALPPTAERCVLATQLDISALRPEWEAAIVQLSVDASLAEVSQRHGGRSDVLSTIPAAWIAPQTCVVKLAPKLFGMLAGVSRQIAVHWAVGLAGAGKRQFSPYLNGALEAAAAEEAAVLLAVDLSGAFRPDDVRAAVARSQLVGEGLQQEAAAILAEVSGLRLTVDAGETLRARLQLDVGADAAPLADAAKPLLLGLLAKSGAMLDEFDQWTASAAGKSLAIEGELSLDGLRRLLSLVAINPTAVQAATAESGQADSSAPTPRDAGDKERTAAATRRYFQGVSQYIDDLNRLNRARSLDQAAMWLENYARRIDALSTRYVDPEVVQYGQYVAQTLRSIVDQAYGVAQSAAQLAAPPQPKEYRLGLLPTANTVNYGGYRMREYAPYGYLDYPSAQEMREQRQQTADQMYESVKQARAALDKLIADHATVRQRLTERYGKGF